jgi:TRAP-type C4-dicarboxylate transport system substrate-binding protein
MARAGRTPAVPSRTSKTITNARRLWPYMLMAWERWQSLPPEQKERYRRQAREYAERGRSLIDERRRKQR